jgi:hypothetical protein
MILSNYIIYMAIYESYLKLLYILKVSTPPFWYLEYNLYVWILKVYGLPFSFNESF